MRNQVENKYNKSTREVEEMKLNQDLIITYYEIREEIKEDSYKQIAMVENCLEMAKGLINDFMESHLKNTDKGCLEVDQLEKMLNTYISLSRDIMLRDLKDFEEEKERGSKL